METSFEEFLKNQLSAEVIDYNNPKCINCNDCCSMGTLITEDEYKKIKNFLNSKKGKQLYKEMIAMLKRYKEKGTVYWMCPFSSNLKLCRIYDIRPDMCRQFHCTPSLQGEGYDKSKYDGKYTIHSLFEGRY